MKKYLLSVAYLIAFLLSACSYQPTNATWLTKQINVSLPSANLPQNYHDQQLLTFSYGKQHHSLVTLVDATPSGISVVGLSTLGIRLFTIEYHDKKITTEQNMFIKELPPAPQILSDIMLSIYPITYWQQVLPNGWVLEEGKTSRKLFDDKHQLIVEITYKQTLSKQIRKPVYIKHYIFGYQIAIKSME